MIRFLLKRTKFHRTALMLLAMVLTTTTAWAEAIPSFSYVKADGSTDTHEAIPLDGSETTLSAGWYVVNSDITYDHNITIGGDVTIILANGKTMNVGTSLQYLRSDYSAIGYNYENDNSALTIYGQSLDNSEAGHLSVYCKGDIDGISLGKSYTQHSGNVYVEAEGVVIRAETTFTVNGGNCEARNIKQNTAICAHDANIKDGTVFATGRIAINAAGDVNISGGKTTATNDNSPDKSIYATNITLSWTNPDDYIMANSYQATNGITIADGKTFYDGKGNSYASGTVNADDIARKTLRTFDYRTVTFNSNGGSYVGNQIIAVNSKVTEPTTPTRKGCTFVRWLKDRRPYNFSSPVKKDFLLIAQWSTEVAYIDATGTSDTQEAIILTDFNADATLGSDGEKTWYYVNEEVKLGDIEIEGTVNIVLGDDADCTGNQIAGDDATLNIYGTGKLTLENNDYQCIQCNNLNIYGGQITVTGDCGIQANNGINLGWTQEGDYIDVSNYDGKVTLTKDFRINNTETIISNGSIDDNDIIAGKKLIPTTASSTPVTPDDNATHVSTIEEFKAAIATDGANIVLDADLTNTDHQGITINNDVCINLNGHKFACNKPSFLQISEGHNVEITDLSDSKGGKLSTTGWASVGSNGHCISNHGSLSISNISLICTYNGDNNRVEGIRNEPNSTLTIGSGVSFSGFRIGIPVSYSYENDDEEENEDIGEPAKLYFNALPVFESCQYDIVYNESIMDFSNATAPLALASGQNKINIKSNRPNFTGVYTKDYKRAFTDPTKSTTTNPNDIFNYIEGGDDVEISYLCDEAYVIKTKGYCGVADANEGKNVEWTVADNGNDMLKLTISMNETDGQENYAMADYTTESPAPWANFAATINEVVVGDGVTPGSTFPFDNLSNLTAVTVPVSTLEDYLSNWSAKADVIKSTGKTNTEYIDDITWTLTKTNGDKIDGNFPLKLTFEGVGFMDSFGYGNTPWYAVHSYITEASLPDGLKQIGTYALTGCAITSITIPASVSSIEFAFADCPKLANVTFKGNITEIGSNAFNGCTSLKEISLPNSVTKIGGNAFCRSGLTRITIPALVSEIPMSAFSDCKSLAEVTIPEGVKIIDWAFDGCTSLTEIKIPSSVTSIGQNSFYGCTALKTVRINSTKATCNYLAFMNCNSLERIIVPNGATIAKYLEDKYFNYYNGDKICAEGYCGVSNENEGKNLIWSLMPTGEKDENIPLYALNISVNPDVENQTNFNMMATDDNNPANDPWNGVRDSISEINIGEGVTSIASKAFYSLNKIKYVIIPNSVETIAGNAFSDCSNLKWIIVNNVDKFMNAEGWDDAMKAKLREGKPTLFATGATNEWMTWCSNIEYTKPEGCTVYTVSNVTNDVVNLKLWEGNNLPAFVPVLIKREAGQLSADIKAEFKDVPAAPENDKASTDGTDYKEIYINNYNNQQTVISSVNANNHNNWGTIYANSGAVLNPNNTGWVKNDDEASTYVLYGDKFLWVWADEGIPTNHWILRIRFKESVYMTRSLSIGYGDEDTTSIDEVRWQMADGEWYDLQGRRLDSKPTQKGIYIHNGRKVVKK